MSYVVSVELHNWGPYAGTQSVQLPAGPIAIIGTYDHDPERSNWSGKSWFLNAVRWCLYDLRPSDAANAEAVVHRGERTCHVTVRLSDGVQATRKRDKGSPSFVVTGLPGIDKPAQGGEAERALHAHLGMTAAEFDSGLWVGQKATARLVLAGPTDRAKMVEGWQGLERLRAAEGVATDHAAKHAQAREAALQGVQAARDALPPQPDIDAFRKAQARRDVLRTELSADERALEESAKVERLSVQVEEFDRLNAQGVALKVELDTLPDLTTELTERDQEREKTHEQHAQANREVDRLSELVKGDGFDGRCPVMCDTCPVAPVVAKRGRQMGEQLTAAREVARARALVARSAYARWNETSQAVIEQKAKRSRLDQLRERATELESVVDEFEALPDYVQPLAPNVRQEKRDALQAAERTILECETAQRAIDAGNQRIALLTAQASVADDQARHWLAAARVLRNTRKELAEAASASIEAGANKLLADAGIDLQVQFRWAREGDGLASNCDACGHGYPRGQSVKRCAQCGAERPPKLVERLDFVPSQRSGAADDLAGLAVQLAAVAYLRGVRGAAFGTVFVDEPLAHMDAVNARAFAIRLQAALPELGFEQALIVAHAPGLMAGYPARVTVRSDGKRARVELVA